MLGPPDFAAIRCDGRIVGHVLWFEGLDLQAAIGKSARQTRNHERLAHVRSCPLKHQRFHHEGTLEFNSFLGFYAGPERMFDLGHFGHQIGNINQFFLGVAAGHNDVQVFRFIRQSFDNVIQR